MNINWFPGHMKKTRELLKNNLKLVDIVFELLDSRIPISSRNPEIDEIINNKPRLVILNKCDLSDESVNKKWIDYYRSKNISAIFVNAANNTGTRKIVDSANKVLQDKINRLKEKGIKNKPIRAMIVGIPNVGKSTLINSLAGKKSAKTGNRPGVTTGKQWIRLKGNIELLDTPGILWPKFEDKNVAMNLAFTGAIKDEVLDIETLGLRLLEKLLVNHPSLIEERYKIQILDKSSLQILDEIAMRRGCILRSKEIDYSRIAHALLDEFRSGKIGNITLEYPKDINKNLPI